MDSSLDLCLRESKVGLTYTEAGIIFARADASIRCRDSIRGIIREHIRSGLSTTGFLRREPTATNDNRRDTLQQTHVRNQVSIESTRVSSRYCCSPRGINRLSRRYIAIKIVDLIAELPISRRSFACVIIASDISDVRDAKVTSLVAIGHLWHTIETFLRVTTASGELARNRVGGGRSA